MEKITDVLARDYSHPLKNILKARNIPVWRVAKCAGVSESMVRGFLRGSLNASERVQKRFEQIQKEILALESDLNAA